MEPRSDSQNNFTARYNRTVRGYIRTHGEVTSKAALSAGTNVPAWYIDQIFPD